MDWFELLNTNVEKRGRREVEQALGLSKTTLSQVLNKKYPGNLENVKNKVLAAFGSLKVDCPVMGEIPLQRCLKEQIKPNTLSNPLRIRLYCECQICPNNRKNSA